MMIIYLSFLTTGLSHNTSLLRVFIPVSDTNHKQIRTFFNVISQKNNPNELKLDFTLVQSQSCSDDDMKYDSLFYEQVLPLVINMLESHITIRLLEIRRVYFGADSFPLALCLSIFVNRYACVNVYNVSTCKMYIHIHIPNIYIETHTISVILIIIYYV